MSWIYLTFFSCFLFLKLNSIEIINQKKVIIYFSGQGEFQWAQRIKHVLSKKNHIVEIRYNNPGRINSYEKEFYNYSESLDEFKNFELDFNPDLIFELNKSYASTANCKRVIFVHSIEQWGNLKNKNLINSYDLVVSPKSLSSEIRLCNPGIKILIGYPYHQNHEYSKLNYNDVFFCGFIRGNFPREKKQKFLLKRLDDNKLLSIYGSQKDWGYLEKSFKGTLDFGPDEILKMIQKSGIVLIIHNDHHLKSAIPTSRIFEAAAASALVISDRNPFIEENFGKNVLYLDDLRDTRKTLSQLFKHIDWIKKNPLRAEELARNCHEIFEKNFTLEKQMDLIFSVLYPTKER